MNPMIRTIFRSTIGLVLVCVLQVAPAQSPYPVLVGPGHPVVVAAQPVYTLDTFLRDFRPLEGHHQIWIVHPVTKCPVEVCFDLPCGKLREVEVNRRSIEFDYGRKDIRILFRLNGTVVVK
jgi:hypothetical protein